MRICVVAPELSYQMANSGVGSNAANLTRFFGTIAKVDVTAVVGAHSGENLERIRNAVRDECGARFVSGEDLPTIPGLERLTPSQLRVSYQIYQWLSQESFDAIFFMQYQSTGFSSFQAKRLGIAFERTRLILVLNGPRLWIEEYNLRPPRKRAADLAVDYIEEYCSEHADTVLCPSRSLVEWMRSRGWKLPSDTRLLRTWTPWREVEEVTQPDVSHLVFFGRLETRKGLEIFCEAVSRLARNPPAGCGSLRVDLAGKYAQAGGTKARIYVEEWKLTLPDWVRVKVVENHGKAEVPEYLEANRQALFVFPSLADSFPNAVLECKVRGCAVLVADTSGCDELIAGRDAMFPPTAEGLENKLRDTWRHGAPESRMAFRMRDLELERLELVRELEQESGRWIPPTPRHPAKERISVCVPHHNLGAYLGQTLEAIAAQTYPDFEVIVVDDGSQEPQSTKAFDEAQAQYEGRGWKFIRTQNHGVSHARNTAARAATGTLLMFVDADNIPHPNMLETLEQRLHFANLDAITCYLYAFEDGASSDATDLSLHWGFLGGCLDGAFLYNTLGDANLLVRRAAFDVVAGFRTSKPEGSEDRALLIRLLRKGFRIDCTPESVFAYRIRPGSLSRVPTTWRRGYAVLDAFCEGQQPWLQKLLSLQFGAGAASQTDGEGLPQWAQARLDQMRAKYERERDKRRERDRKADERYERLLAWRRNVYIRFGRFLKIVDRDY